jgi:hypothetical protein
MRYRTLRTVVVVRPEKAEKDEVGFLVERMSDATFYLFYVSSVVIFIFCLQHQVVIFILNMSQP